MFSLGDHTQPPPAGPGRLRRNMAMDEGCRAEGNTLEDRRLLVIEGSTVQRENWGFRCTWASHSIDVSLNFPTSEMGAQKSPS